MSVKNGAELLDRLMKDIVAEAASNYVSMYPSNVNPNLPPPKHSLMTATAGLGISSHSLSQHTTKEDRENPGTSPHRKDGDTGNVASPNRANELEEEDNRAFSLARFIPLLAERVYVISPYTRMHLVSWVMVLDSVPDLELVAWLPEFLDGLL